MVPSLSALVVFATPSEEPLRRSALMYFIRSAAINPATSASTVVVAVAAAAVATDGDACCDVSLLVTPPSSPVKIIHGQGREEAMGAIRVMEQWERVAGRKREEAIEQNQKSSNSRPTKSSLTSSL